MALATSLRAEPGTLSHRHLKIEGAISDSVALPREDGPGEVLLLSRPLDDKLEVIDPVSNQRAIIDLGTERGMVSFRWLDLDGDGSHELVGLTRTGTSLDVYRRRARNEFERVSSIPVSSSVGFEVGDLTADGKPDVVVRGEDGKTFTLYPQTDGLRFERGRGLELPEPTVNGFGILREREGVSSVSFSLESSDRCQMWRADASKAGTTQVALPDIFDRVEVADFDGDGDGVSLVRRDSWARQPDVRLGATGLEPATYGFGDHSHGATSRIFK